MHIACLLIGLAVHTVRAAESVSLEIVPASQGLLAAGGEAEPLRPAAGQVLVCGRFDDPAFYVDDLSQLTVVRPDGRQVALTVDAGSLFVEFDQIVSLRFCFALDAAEAEAGGLVLRWGPDVRADNVQVDALAFDASQPQLYRGFRWLREDAAEASDAQLASIEVIADSTAGLHFLWYLLPIGVIFLLLTIRKVRARHPPS